MPIGSGGIAEVFLPAGGTSGQVLEKTAAADYAMDWVDPGAGGGGIMSISGGTTEGLGPRVVFSNSPTVSFGMAGNTMTASAAGGGGGSINLSAGTTSNNLTNFVLSNLNNVSFGLNGSTITATVTVPAQSNQTGNIYGSSQTFGQSSSSSYDVRSLTIYGSGGVSVGWSNGSLGISGQTTAAQSNQTGNIYASSQTFGQSSSSSYDHRSLTIYGSGGISVGWSNGSLGLSVPNSVAQSNQTGNIYASSQTFGQSSSSSYDHRSLTIYGSGGISVGWSNGSLGLSVPNAVAQTNQTGGIYNSSQTTGASSSSTYDLRSITHVFSGNISGGWTNGSLLFNVTTAAQTNQTLGIYASNNTFGQSSSSTYDARSLSFYGSDNISLGWSNGSLIIKGGAGGGGAAVSLPANGANRTSGGAGYSNISTGTANFFGSNITLSQDGASITISGNNPGAAAENNWINLLGANTAGDTTASGSTIGWSGINLTLSGSNGSQVKISAPATSSLVGSSGISLSTNGSTITVGQVLASYYDNVAGAWANSTTLQMLQSTSHIQPFVLDSPISFGFIRIPMSNSNAASSTAATTGNSSWSYGHSRSHNFVIYSRGVGGSSMSLQSVASTQLTDQQSIRVSANANSTQFSYTNRATYQMSTGPVDYTYDYSSSAASLNFHTSNMTAATGRKMMEFVWATTLPPGQYWLMYGVSSSTASQFTNVGTRLFNIFSQYGMSMPNLQFGTMGADTDNSVGPFFGLGSFTTGGGAGTTNSLNISKVTTSAAHLKMMFQLANIA